MPVAMNTILAPRSASDAVAVFDSGTAADIRVGACAQALVRAADLNLHRRTVAAQGLRRYWWR